MPNLRSKGSIIGSIVGGVISSSSLTMSGCGEMVQAVPTGTVETRTEVLERWNHIRLDGAFKVIVFVDAGCEPKVEISADAALLPYLKAVTHGEVLSFEFTNSINIVGGNLTHGPIFKVYTPDPVTEISISGSGKLEISGIQQVSLDASLSGTGSLRLAGTATRLSLDISGTGKVDAQELSNTQATISIAGTGKATLNTRTVKGDISGTGTLSIPHNALSSVSISGVGKIRRY